jgi:hypothetical protein
MSYTIKHMGIGGILDQAISIVKDHFMLLFKIMLFGVIPISFVQHFLTITGTPELPPNPTLQDYMRQQSEPNVYAIWIGGLSFISGIVLILTNAAVIQAVARLYLGETITALEALKHGTRRFWALLGTSILVGLVVMFGFLLLIIPGIYFTIWYGLSTHVVVLEGLSGLAAMRRSKKLVHKDRGKFLALALITFVISMMVAAAPRFIPQPHLAAALAAVMGGLTTMLTTAAFVVFYFSCRCNVENFDLHYLAESIGAPSAEGEMNPALTPGAM